MSWPCEQDEAVAAVVQVVASPCMNGRGGGRREKSSSLVAMVGLEGGEK